MQARWAGIVVVAGMLGAAPGDQPKRAAVVDATVAPDGWHLESARPEIAPRSWIEEAEESGGAFRLGMAGRGDRAVDGRWVRRVAAEAGKDYLFAARYCAEAVPNPLRSVLARVLWYDADGKQLGTTEYPETRGDPDPEGWTLVSSRYRAPERTAAAQLELHLRWAPEGKVLWEGARLEESSATPTRMVRLASVNHRPRGSSSPGENVERFASLVEEAGRRGADIVCLPEGITVVGTGSKYAEVAEPIPGPTTRRLGDAARAGRLYVVAGLYERDGKAIYNSSVLIGPDGALVGTYRKVCLPREEIEGGITPGVEYPVFDTDLGRVGMMICWDVHFPEVARELASRGAEVILMPIWGGNETLARARAIENQIYLVASGYDFPSAIYDQAGEAIASTTTDPEILVADVDLNARRMWPWLGDWKARIWREGPARAPESSSPTP